MSWQDASSASKELLIIWSLLRPASHQPTNHLNRAMTENTSINPKYVCVHSTTVFSVRRELESMQCHDTEYSCQDPTRADGILESIF